MKSKLRSQPPANRRYLSDQPLRKQEYLRAAQEYTSHMTADEVSWLFTKPYDASPGNLEYFQQMYSVLNIFQAMDITPKGRILEVGCGPGWITEMFALCGYDIVALDPSAGMLEIARKRVESAISHHRLGNPPTVEFLCSSLEDCTFEDESFDAVFFHEALHHIIDEEIALTKVFNSLRPGGSLGVSKEGAWKPGNRQLEEQLDNEMERFGTLKTHSLVSTLIGCWIV
jgi:ubiquinone/menaquinone biosynthesis C-methylase UbiE